uniref:Histone domain-containing protein n=1 Tax=Steinernema glaseri TaxID=37863 RepID=A0A1I7ZQQ7_9BILA
MAIRERRYMGKSEKDTVTSRLDMTRLRRGYRSSVVVFGEDTNASTETAEEVATYSARTSAGCSTPPPPPTSQFALPQRMHILRITYMVQASRWCNQIRYPNENQNEIHATEIKKRASGRTDEWARRTSLDANTIFDVMHFITKCMREREVGSGVQTVDQLEIKFAPHCSLWNVIGLEGNATRRTDGSMKPLHRKAIKLESAREQRTR